MLRTIGNVTHSFPIHLFSAPWKYQKTKRFLLYVLVMSRTRFRVNPHSLVAWMSRNSLLETGGNRVRETIRNASLYIQRCYFVADVSLFHFVMYSRCDFFEFFFTLNIINGFIRRVWNFQADFHCLSKLCLIRWDLSHSIVAWMSRNSLLEAGAKSEV